MRQKGFKHSQETKRKMSEAHKGIKFSNGHKRKLSEAHKGLKLSEITKRKLSKIHKGRKFSNEHKINISKAFKGRKYSDETRIRMSLAHIDKPSPMKDRKFSNEHKINMSIAQSNRILKNGGINPSLKYTVKGKYFSEKNKYYIYYDSSYELLAFEILEQLSQIKHYSRCQFSINYKINGLTKRYIPDILIEYLNGKKEVIEVKPEYAILKEINQAKFKAAKIYCNNNNLKFSVWTEKEIGKC